MTELPLPLAFLRGLVISSLVLVLGMLEDLRLPLWSRTHLCLGLITGITLIMGFIFFAYAWNWAGRDGPVHRLASRACGVALGYLVPAIAASHALYFHWVGAFQSALGNQLLHLAGLISHG